MGASQNVHPRLRAAQQSSETLAPQFKTIVGMEVAAVDDAKLVVLSRHDSPREVCTVISIGDRQNRLMP